MLLWKVGWHVWRRVFDDVVGVRISYRQASRAGVGKRSRRLVASLRRRHRGREGIVARGAWDTDASVLELHKSRSTPDGIHCQFVLKNYATLTNVDRRNRSTSHKSHKLSGENRLRSSGGEGVGERLARLGSIPEHVSS